MNLLFGDLVFCKDNTLRIVKTINGKIVNIPLSDIQEYLNEPNIFILQFLSSKIKFEKNLTLSNLLLALKPWNETLSYYLKIDLNAYCKACFSLTTKTSDLDYISIQKEIYVTRKMFRPKREKGVSISDHINKTKLTETKDFETQSEIKSLGVSNGNEFSITGSSFNSIKNIPLVINDVLTLKIKAPTDHEKTIFSDQINGLINKEEIRQSVGEISTKNTVFLLSEILQSISNDVLDFSPVSDEEADSFSDVVSKIFNEAVVEQIKKPKLKLVNNTEQKEDEDKDKDKDKTKVSIKHAFIDDLIKQKNAESQFWHELFERIAPTSNITIGKIID